MNLQTPSVAAALAVVTAQQGVSINGIMAEIGHSHGGNKKFSDTQVFGAVQFLKNSGTIKEDTRVKKNQGLYLKDTNIVEMHPEPIKVSYRATPQPRAPKLDPQFQLRKKNGENWEVIEQNDNLAMLEAFKGSMEKDKANKGVIFDILDTRPPEPEAPATTTEEAPKEPATAGAEA